MVQLFEFAFLAIVSALLSSCSADFYFANKQDSRFGAFGNSVMSLSRLPSQHGGNSVNPTPASSPSLNSQSGGKLLLNIASSPLSGSSGSNNGNTRPISFIPNSSSSTNTNNINNNNGSNNPSGTTVNSSHKYNRCVQRSSRDFRPHSRDCSKFTLCTFGRLVDLDCPQGSVYHARTASCVPRGSAYDLCTRVSQACPPGHTGKVADPLHCARYYHCGRLAQHARWEAGLHECPYPKLFNNATLQCEHFSTVNCGRRDEPKDPCEYRANGCDGHVSCVPCAVRFPSCRGRPDGINHRIRSIQNAQQAIRHSSVIFVAPYWNYRISCLKVQLAPLAQDADSEKWN